MERSRSRSSRGERQSAGHVMTTSENTRNLWCILPCLDESLEVTGLLPAVMCGIIDQRTREGKLSENSNRMLMAGLGEGLGEDE